MPVIVGSVVSLGCTLFFAKMRKDKDIPEEYRLKASEPLAQTGSAAGTMSPLTACMPFILIFVLLLLTFYLSSIN
jgi:L-lactate permease